MRGFVTVKSIVLLCAFRYALGRQSGIVKTICEEIEAALDQLDWITMSLMVQEIQEASERGALGMDCDEQQWRLLHKNIRGELARRDERDW